MSVIYTVAAKLERDNIRFDNQSKKLHFYFADQFYFDVALT